MNVQTGAPTRPATSSSLSGVVTRRMSASIRSARMSCHAGTGADGADTVELLLVDDPRELLTEMERLGPRRKDRRAFGAEGRRGLVVVGDGVEAREAGVGGAPEDDRADRELHLVQLLLD